jgi:hypothetical protein
MKRKAIIIGEKESKDIQFTHYLNGTGGWQISHPKYDEYSKVVYLGKCNIDGDMFAAYFREEETIAIYKGYLNDGTY